MANNPHSFVDKEPFYALSIAAGYLAMWISHGIREQIKLLSELSLTASLEVRHIPSSDLRSTVTTYIKSIWQHEGEENINHKLHEILPSVGGGGGRWAIWSLAAAVLATRGLHMLSYSRGNLPLSVLDISPH